MTAYNPPMSENLAGGHAGDPSTWACRPPPRIFEIPGCADAGGVAPVPLALLSERLASALLDLLPEHVQQVMLIREMRTLSEDLARVVMEWDRSVLSVEYDLDDDDDE